MLGASTIILSKDIDKYAFMCGSNFYETDVMSIPHSLQLKLETSYELLLLLQVVLTCNLIRIQLLVLDGNPSKFPFEANGGEKRRKISGISVKSQQCTHVWNVQQAAPQRRLLATQLPTDPSNEQFSALIC